MPYDHTVFKDNARRHLFNHDLTLEEKQGMEDLLVYGELRRWDSAEIYLRRWLAYLFATTYHETAYRMWPIEEYGSQSYLQGKSYYPWYGRGFVQLTWEENYERAERLILENAAKEDPDERWLENGAHLRNGELCQMGSLEHVDQALDSEVAACVIYCGMWQGWFTGAKLWDYLRNDRKDYFNARRIVNSTDKASQIADYANEFELCFDAAWLPERPEEPEQPPIEEVPDKPEPPPDIELPPGFPNLPLIPQPEPEPPSGVPAPERLDEFFKSNPHIESVSVDFGNPYYGNKD